MGAVNTVAPSELDTLVMTTARSFLAFAPFLLNRSDSRRCIAGETSTRPSMDAKESCRLAEAMLIGLAASSSISAKAKLVGASDSRLNIGAAMLKSSMTQARTIALEQPIISVNTTTSGAPISAARRFPASATTADHKKPRCIPETDMTCDTPVTERALSSSQSS